MRKIMLLGLSALFLSGCAAYRFQHGKSPYDKGYLVSRDSYAILEYTVGKDNSVPEELSLAKQRFKRRRYAVERYYKKMGYIENRFKEWFWDPPKYFVKLVTGVFRMPAIAISDYRYNHNAKYRARVIKREEEQDLREETIIKRLRKSLSEYIQKDMEKEEGVAAAVQESKPAQQAEVQAEVVKPKVKKAAKKAARASGEPVASKPEASKPMALIMAKPQKGYSPLRVRFFAGKSYSPGARIVSYAWDFGDGDTSTKKNPINTFVSTSYEAREFTVTLTITDSNGRSVSTQQSIEVLNK